MRSSVILTLLFCRDRDRTLTQATLPPFQPQRTDGPKFTGGGFNLKQPAKIPV